MAAVDKKVLTDRVKENTEDPNKEITSGDINFSRDDTYFSIDTAAPFREGYYKEVWRFWSF